METTTGFRVYHGDLIKLMEKKMETTTGFKV